MIRSPSNAIISSDDTRCEKSSDRNVGDQSTPNWNEQNSGAQTSEQDTVDTKKKSQGNKTTALEVASEKTNEERNAQKDDDDSTVALLQQLRSDLVYLDGRVNHLTHVAASENNGASAAAFLRDKLRKMEAEKGETEQVLSTLRVKLEEHKRLSKLKRLRLRQRSGSGRVVNRDHAAVASSSSSSTGTMPLVLEGMEKLPGGHTVDDEATTCSSIDAGEREAIELEKRIKDLELQKENMGRTLLKLLSTYETKTHSLQQEKVRLKDEKNTTYNEMKELLIEQHLESERLREKVVKLENKRKRMLRTVWQSVAAIFVVIISGAVFQLIGSKGLFFSGTRGSSGNYWCAPARPGSQVSEANSPVEAPWWVTVPFAKPILFAMVCGNHRPRTRLEVDRGTLFISDSNDPLASVTKRFGDFVYVESDTLHITDRRGGHKEIEAPWAIHLLKSQIYQQAQRQPT